MKTAAAIAILALAVVAFGARAQDSVDDVIARNIKARGGLERMKSIQTIRQTSVVHTNGMELALTVSSKRPNRVRQEVEVGGRLVINGFDGETAWIVNPLLGEPARPVVLSGPQAEQIRVDSSFDGPLVDYKALGFRVAIDEPEPVPGEEGRSLVHLRLTAPGGRVTRVYLDPATWLDVKHVSVNGPTRMEQHFDDYRTIDGFTAPFLIRQVVNGVTQAEIRVSQVEFNTPMDDGLFRLPK